MNTSVYIALFCVVLVALFSGVSAGTSPEVSKGAKAAPLLTPNVIVDSVEAVGNMISPH
jgi:hypothetical protein